MRTQIGIVGAGPAGLMLAHLLDREGIESAVIEARSRRHVQERVRAGVLEQGTVDLMRDSGVGARLAREGLVHRGFELRFSRRAHRIDLSGLTGGKAITIYGQNEVIKDLTDARLAAGGAIHFECEQVRVEGIGGGEPAIHFASGGATHEVRCDFIAGCDGFHGICRPSIPAAALTIYERVYPFAWLGILAKTPPSSDELIYARHERGFALHSMRSRELTRLYLQCAPDEKLEDWPDARIWDELDRRFEIEGGWKLARGPITHKGVTDMRSFVAEPMRYRSLFLAGDAAHIVPPTGAKGLNLAIADVRVLARGLARFYHSGDRAGLDAYSEVCLRRVWKVQRFSWWMTSILHRLDGQSAFDTRRQLAELEYLTSSRAAAESLAENYVGLPMDSQ
ncbi:MAG TPA: 4-hydroxybenzoate 3-monooxygenase [Candidatus Binataceae bacterium]|nr:4-hydroxybenzoate 3-monooxygenase [Candidatus Binataceae bacterium]